MKKLIDFFLKSGIDPITQRFNYEPQFTNKGARAILCYIIFVPILVTLVILHSAKSDLAILPTIGIVCVSTALLLSAGSYLYWRDLLKARYRSLYALYITTYKRKRRQSLGNLFELDLQINDELTKIISGHGNASIARNVNAILRVSGNDESDISFKIFFLKDEEKITEDSELIIKGKIPIENFLKFFPSVIRTDILNIIRG